MTPAQVRYLVTLAMATLVLALGFGIVVGATFRVVCGR